jgi:hypothetical protein
MKKLTPAVDGFRGLASVTFFLVFIYTHFFLKLQNGTKNNSHFGPWQGSFHWRTTPIMNDFYSSEYSYISLTLICMKWQPANHFILLQSPHLHYLLCLFKLWTCHIHLDPPPSLFVFSFIAIFLFSLLWPFTDCFWSSLKRECVVWVENYICMLERGLRVFVGFGKDPAFFAGK